MIPVRSGAQFARTFPAHGDGWRDARAATRGFAGGTAVAAAVRGDLRGLEPVDGEYRAACNAVSWGAAAGGLRVDVQCRNGAGQYLDTRHDVRVIE